MLQLATSVFLFIITYISRRVPHFHILDMEPKEIKNRMKVVCFFFLSLGSKRVSQNT